LKAAGIKKDFRFHDLRHTWASWHTQAGTPMLILQKLGGWKTLSMLNRYSHLNAEHLFQQAGASNFYGRIQPQPDAETKTATG
jgi:integrase